MGGIKMEGLVWGEKHQFAEIGYGIKKLQVQATVVDDLVGVDDLVEKIQDNEDLVQSLTCSPSTRSKRLSTVSSANRLNNLISASDMTYANEAMSPISSYGPCNLNFNTSASSN